MYKAKMHEHGSFYAQQGFLFVPSIPTTFGRLDITFLRFLFILAYCQAPNVLAVHRPCADFSQQLGKRCVANRAKIVVTLAKAMALRIFSRNECRIRRISLPAVFMAVALLHHFLDLHVWFGMMLHHSLLLLDIF